MGPSVCLVSEGSSASAIRWPADVGLMTSMSLKVGGEMVRSCPGKCVFRGLSFGWRSLLGGTETSISTHKAQPEARGSKEHCGGIRGGQVCVPPGSRRLDRSVRCCHHSGELRGALLRVHIAQDLLKQQPEAVVFRQEHRCSCNEPSDLVTHSSLPKQPVLM